MESSSIIPSGNSLSSDTELIASVEEEGRTDDLTLHLCRRTGDTFLSAKVNGTIGGKKGHIARRIYHVMVFGTAPVLFFYLHSLALSWHTTPIKIVSVCTILIILIEAIRLKFGIIIFGMREYERDVISAQFR